MSSSFRIWCIGLLLAGFTHPGLGVESLASLFREAKEQNATYLATKAGTEADLEGVSIARGQLLPNVGINGNYGKSDTARRIGSNSEENFNYETYTYGLSLRQPLYRKSSFASYQQAIAQGEVAKAKLDQAEAELAIRVVSSYLEALFSDDQADLIAAQKAAVTAQLAAAEKNLVAGTGTRIDIDEAQAKYDLLIAQELEIKNSQQHNRRVLASTVNRGIGILSRLDIQHFSPKPPSPGETDTLIRDAESNNCEYQAAIAQRKVAEQEVEKALAGHYPTLDFVASTGRSGNDNVSSLNRLGDTEYKTTSYGVQLVLPLFAGWQVNGTVRQARAKLDQANHLAEDLRRSISVKVHKEFDNLIQGLARIVALKRAEASAMQTVISTKKGILAGVRSTLDVLQAEQTLFTARRDLAQARYAYLIAEIKLKGLTGLISEDDIDNLSNQFSAPSNYSSSPQADTSSLAPILPGMLTNRH